MSAVLTCDPVFGDIGLLAPVSVPRSELPATPETVWPFVEAGCSYREVADWFGISLAGAKWEMRLAKRRHLVEDCE